MKRNKSLARKVFDDGRETLELLLVVANLLLKQLPHLGNLAEVFSRRGHRLSDAAARCLLRMVKRGRGLGLQHLALTRP